MESSNEVPKRKRGRPLSKTGVISVQSKDPAPSSPSTPEKGQTSQIAKRRGRPPKNCASTPESTSFKGASSTNNDTKRRIRPSVVPVGRETIVSKKGETPSRNRLENFTPVKVDYEIQKRGCKPRSVSVPPPNSKVNQKGNVKVERDLKRSLSRERVPSKLRKIKIPPKSSEFLEDSDDSHESSLIKIDSDQKIFLSRYQPVSRGRNRGSPKNKVDNNNQFDVANDSTKFNRLRKPLQSDIEAFKVKKEREMQNDFSNKNFCGPQRVRPSLESNNKDKFDDVKGSTTLRKLNRSVSRGRQRRSSSESSSNETNLAQNFKKKSGKSQVRNLSVPHDLKRKRSSLKDNEEINHSDRNRSMSRGRPLSKSKAEDGKNKNSDTQDFTTKKKTEKTPLRSVSRGRQRRLSPQTNEFVEDDNNSYQSKINKINKIYHEIESRQLSSSSSEKRYGRLPSKNQSVVIPVNNKVERLRRSQTPKNQQETIEISTIKRRPSKLNGLRKDPTSESSSTQKSNKKTSTEMSSRITKGTQHSIKNFQNNPIKTVKKKAYSEIPIESSPFNYEYTESESYSQKSNFPVKTAGDKGKSSFESFNESETEIVPQTRGGLGKSVHLIPLVYYSNESESDSEFEFVPDNLDNLEFEKIPVRGKRLFSFPPQNNDPEIESPKELSSEEESLREKIDECTTTKIHEKNESELDDNSSISIVDKETVETLPKLKPERPLKNKIETNEQLQTLQLDNSMNQVITDRSSREKSLDNQDRQLISENTQNNLGNLNMQMPMLIEHWSPSGIENGCIENSVDHYLHEPIERMEKKIDTMIQDNGLIEPSAVLWLNSTNNNNNEIVNAFRIGANDDLFMGNQFSMESSQFTSNQDISTESSIAVPNEILLSEELSDLSNEIFDFSFFDSLLLSQENDFMDLDRNPL